MSIRKQIRAFFNRHKKLKNVTLRVLDSRIYNLLLCRPWEDDRTYVENLYYERFGVKPDLDDPKNFNEKNNWRKLYDRNPIYTDMVDKYLLKGIVAQKVGEQYVFPLLGVWDDPAKIDYDSLPEQFVLKTNHAGGVIICRDKSAFKKKQAARELKKTLKMDYFMRSREWPYKNVKRKVIAEQYMGENLIDFKNYCFNGELKYTLVWKNQSREDGRKPTAYFCGSYDRDWEKTDMALDYPSLPDEVTEKPACYDELVKVCEAMSAGIPFVRVDCYIIDGHVYVGEMTFFPWGGFQKFKDDTWNDKLGQMEILPKDTKE